mgnify:CR=1 FL=1
MGNMSHCTPISRLPHSNLQPLTKDLVRTRANIQLLDVKGGRAENISEFVALGINGSLNIQGTAELMQPDFEDQVYQVILVGAVLTLFFVFGVVQGLVYPLCNPLLLSIQM